MFLQEKSLVGDRNSNSAWLKQMEFINSRSRRPNSALDLGSLLAALSELVSLSADAPHDLTKVAACGSWDQTIAM